MKKNNICFSVIFRVAGSICILIAAALLYVYMFLVESPSLSMIFLLIAILASGILLLTLGRLKDNKEKNIYKKLIMSSKNKKLCMSAKFKIAGYTCVLFSIIFYFVCLFFNWNSIPFISVFAIAIIVFGILFLILGYNWKKTKMNI